VTVLEVSIVVAECQDTRTFGKLEIMGRVPGVNCGLTIATLPVGPALLNRLPSVLSLVITWCFLFLYLHLMIT
jgi:hypothetical protein